MMGHADPMTCSWSRVLIAGAGIGMAAAWITGSDAYGWVASSIGILGTVVYERRSGTRRGATCALPAVDLDRSMEA
jgi:hypothetical protein